MTDDIVARLREEKCVVTNGVRRAVPIDPIHLEAADEIEQLRIGYQQAMNELEKVIAERDSLRRAGDELHRALGILADPDDYNWRTIDIEYLLDRWARVRK